MKRSDRLPFAALSVIAFASAAAWLVHSGFLALPFVGSTGVALACGLGMALYLVSHALRAIRLAVIGVAIHKTSFRTLALLNFAVAPWSMILPFKLDELVRVNELRSLSGSLERAAMTIVIDRSMDGPMLLLCAAYLDRHGNAAIAQAAGLAGIAMVTITLGFIVTAQLLHFIQHYIFLYHYRPRAIRALHVIHRLRQLAELGRATILRTAPILMMCTLAIWLFEIAAVGLLLSALGTTGTVDLVTAMTATFVRANAGWQAILLGSPFGFPAGQITTVFTLGLLLMWPFAIVGYVRRRKVELRDAEFLHRQLA